MAEQLYFAYGSNMDLKQMDFRCPDAQVVENVRLPLHSIFQPEDHRPLQCRLSLW